MLEKSNRIQKENDNDPIINGQIKYPKVRLIDVSGEQLGIYSSIDAMNIAIQKDLDLVMISNKSNPPVCRIIDYGKYKFTQEKKAKEARRKQHNAVLKEVKMRYKIEEHDYRVRINQALRFLQTGDKVKATITFRGREIQHTDLAISLLKKMASDLSSVADVQQLPFKDGRQMIMVLSPKKNMH